MSLITLTSWVEINPETLTEIYFYSEYCSEPWFTLSASHVLENVLVARDIAEDKEM